MSSGKLKKVLTSCDFNHDVASKLVLEALFFKVDDAPYPEWSLEAEESASSSSSRPFVERAYKYHRVKVVKIKLPRQQCVVYLDLKQEECTDLFSSGRVYSQAFNLVGQGFYLCAHCSMAHLSPFHYFGLFLGMQEKGSASFTVDYEFAARSRPKEEEFISKYRGNYTFKGGERAIGSKNLLKIPWTSFMAEDCLYFIDGVLHLRAVVSVA